MGSSKGKSRLSAISPGDITAALKPLQPLLVQNSLKRFLGLGIKATGKIFMIDDWGSHATINLYHNGVHVSANFDKPVPAELTVLKKGDSISLIGRVFNATGDIVVLDHCELEPPGEATSPTRKVLPSWDEAWWGKLIIIVLGGLCVAAIVASIGYLIHFWRK